MRSRPSGGDLGFGEAIMSWLDDTMSFLKIRSSRLPLCVGRAKPFDKDMWMGFAGAENWSDGSHPIYREFDDGRLVIVSKAGIECHIPDGDDEPVWYRVDMEVPTQDMGMLILNALPEDFSLVECGFRLQ